MKLEVKNSGLIRLRWNVAVSGLAKLACSWRTLSRKMAEMFRVDSRKLVMAATSSAR